MVFKHTPEYKYRQMLHLLIRSNSRPGGKKTIKLKVIVFLFLYRYIRQMHHSSASCQVWQHSELRFLPRASWVNSHPSQCRVWWWTKEQKKKSDYRFVACAFSCSSLLRARVERFSPWPALHRRLGIDEPWNTDHFRNGTETFENRVPLM